VVSIGKKTFKHMRDYNLVTYSFWETSDGPICSIRSLRNVEA